MAELQYDVAFRNDRAASGLAKWSRMNLFIRFSHPEPFFNSVRTSSDFWMVFNLFQLNVRRSQFTAAVLGMGVHVAGHLVDTDIVM